MESRQSPGTIAFPTNPEEFDSDDRISFSKLDNKFLLVQEDGTEYEFEDVIKRWIPVLDEGQFEEQQKAYKVPGVDESEPVDGMKRKRKKEYVNGEDEGGRLTKVSRKAKTPLPPRANRAIYVTGLPLDATVSEVAEVFARKGGVIEEEIESGQPRIKLYTDEQGQPKGEALIHFFKAPSVDMAIMLLDGTDFRIGNGQGSGKMRVQAADMSYKKSQQNDATEKERPKTSLKDKQKIIKKTQKLDARLADWSDDEPSSIVETKSKWDKVVILKHMFSLQELEDDPGAILDIKEDIREECSKLGEVTNVVLFDLEADGIASVRFTSAEAARACINVMDGRSFAGQKVEAYVSDGKEQFKKSKKKVDDGSVESTIENT